MNISSEQVWGGPVRLSAESKLHHRLSICRITKLKEDMIPLPPNISMIEVSAILPSIFKYGPDVHECLSDLSHSADSQMQMLCLLNSRGTIDYID